MAVSDSLLDIIDQGSVSNRIELMKIIAGRGSCEDTGILQSIVIALGDRKEVVKIAAIKAAAAVKSRHLMQYLGDLLHEKHHKIRMKQQGTSDIGVRRVLIISSVSLRIKMKMYRRWPDLFFLSWR
jgi:hypothetical protein